MTPLIKILSSPLDLQMPLSWTASTSWKCSEKLRWVGAPKASNLSGGGQQDDCQKIIAYPGVLAGYVLEKLIFFQECGHCSQGSPGTPGALGAQELDDS